MRAGRVKLPEPHEAQLDADNRVHGMRRYCEILLRPESDPDGKDLHPLMTDLGVTAEKVKDDVKLIERLRYLRENVARGEGSREKIAELKRKLNAAQEAVKNIQREIGNWLSRETVVCNSRCEIETLAQKRHELFATAIFDVTQEEPHEVYRATRDGGREMLFPPPVLFRQERGSPRNPAPRRVAFALDGRAGATVASGPRPFFFSPSWAGKRVGWKTAACGPPITLLLL